MYHYVVIITNTWSETTHIEGGHCGAVVKLVLHPIVRVYTRKCAANVVEEYECSLVVG